MDDTFQIKPLDADLYEAAMAIALSDERRRMEALDHDRRGTFCEALVVKALPGSSYGKSWGAVDVEWQGIKIQVKCNGAQQSRHDQLSPARWGTPAKPVCLPHQPIGTTRGRFFDVYVLARHEGATLDAGWTFYVIAASDVKSRNTTPKRALALGAIQTDVDGLAEAVQSATRKPPGANPGGSSEAME